MAATVEMTLRNGRWQLLPLMLALVLAALAAVGPQGRVAAQDAPATIPQEAPGPQPSPQPLPSPAPSKDPLADSTVYTEAVRLHLEPDPALAATYIAFWSALRHSPADAEPEAAPADATPPVTDSPRYQTLLGTGTRIAEVLRARYPEGSRSYRLADTLSVALASVDTPETLLATVDAGVAPHVVVNGRHAYAGSLQGPADLGFAADVWQRCRGSAACVAAHDALFGQALAGLSLSTDAEQRVEKDKALGSSPTLAGLLANLATLKARASAGDGPTAVNTVWQMLAAGLGAADGRPDASAAGAAGPVPARDGKPASRTKSDGKATGASAPVSSTAPEVEALLTLGRSSAYLMGGEPLANAFGVISGPAVEFARFSHAANWAGTFIGATAGVGLLVAGVQALSLFDGGNAGPPPAELARMLADLQDSTAREFASLRTENLLASNATDTRLARLGVALDVVKDDVARIETGQRTRLRADFLADDARRWTAFEGDNERCFALRSRDPDTGRLRAAEFRRCEDRFLEGAVRRSLYATRATDYGFDARYVEPADLRFAFHHHYPLLLKLGGTDTKATLGLADPLEWQQHAAALLRLYIENPAAESAHAQRAEVLRSVRASGARVQSALRGLVLVPPSAGTFRDDLHERALDDYFNALEALAARVRALDDPETDRYAKRLTEGLVQPLPTGRKLDAIDAALSGPRSSSGQPASNRSGSGKSASGKSGNWSAGPGLAACADAGDTEFLAPEKSLTVAMRRFFGEPITAGEIDRSWNRNVIPDFELALASPAKLVPPAFVWAALDGLGRIEVCLSRLRPERLEFTRDELQPDHLRADATLRAEVQVRFTPSAAVTTILGREADRPLTIGHYAAERRCSFGYRDDDRGCSRGACLARVAPVFWSGTDDRALNGGRCEDPPLATAIGSASNVVAGDDEVEGIAAALAVPYWQGRADRIARLEADALRSSEYQAAASSYLQYYALAGTTLGTWPEVGEPLAPLFAAEGELAPRAVIEALLRERRAVDALTADLHAKQTAVLERVKARGNELETSGGAARLPAIRALDETLTRIDLLLAGYR